MNGSLGLQPSRQDQSIHSIRRDHLRDHQKYESRWGLLMIAFIGLWTAAVEARKAGVSNTKSVLRKHPGDNSNQQTSRQDAIDLLLRSIDVSAIARQVNLFFSPELVVHKGANYHDY